MSYELVGIMVLGFMGLIQMAGLVYCIVTVNQGFREMSRIQRAVASLVVQESERLQALIRGLEAQG